jgi:hypothetical protein
LCITANGFAGEYQYATLPDGSHNNGQLRREIAVSSGMQTTYTSGAIDKAFSPQIPGSRRCPVLAVAFSSRFAGSGRSGVNESHGAVAATHRIRLPRLGVPGS